MSVAETDTGNDQEQRSFLAHHVRAAFLDIIKYRGRTSQSLAQERKNLTNVREQTGSAYESET